MSVIPIVPATGQRTDCNSLIDAVLREVGERLARLAREPGFADAIDLHSLPLDDGQRTTLRERLGRGEVDARLQVAGPTEVAETAYAGVWWVRHADAEQQTLLEQIVVARVPELLLAHPADIASAANRLATDIGDARAAAATCDPDQEILDG